MNTKIFILKHCRRVAQLVIALGLGLSLFTPQAVSKNSRINFGTWKAVLVSKDEPGEPLIVTGTIYQPDGKTPASGIGVYVYHTDAEGYYRKGTNSSENPRLKGVMKTNSDGKYEFRTIKPGAYPGGGNPAHIHYVLSGKGYAEQRDELMFAGDPYLTPQQKGSSHVRPLTRDTEGVWRCIYDIKLKQN